MTHLLQRLLDNEKRAQMAGPKSVQRAAPPQTMAPSGPPPRTPTPATMPRVKLPSDTTRPAMRTYTPPKDVDYR